MKLIYFDKYLYLLYERAPSVLLSAHLTTLSYLPCTLKIDPTYKLSKPTPGTPYLFKNGLFNFKSCYAN